jgi:hypothetical protein
MIQLLDFAEAYPFMALERVGALHGDHLKEGE